MNKLTLIFLAAAMTFAAGAQDAATDSGDVSVSGNGGSGQVSFTGDDIRVGIGLDDDGDVHGEYFHVFGEDKNSAWIAEGYVSDDRGGLKLNYHWLSGVESLEAAVGRDNDVRVRKLFLAMDENELDDRKATFGFGSESPRLFWGVYGMKSTTGTRFAGQTIDTSSVTNTIIDGNQVFEQDVFTDTITSFFERPYDYGVGARVGHYFEDSLVRLRGGVDYEDGKQGADQLTFSVGVEKYFANTGHSLALTAEHYNKSGSLELDDTDTRALLMYRYSFGERYRAKREFVEREVTVDGASAEPATRTERRPVQNRIEITDEAYFDFDKSVIRSDAATVLQSLAGQIGEKEIIGDIRVIGHTCSIGTEAYNQGLSERRARSAVAFLTENGITGDRIVWEARGELDPRYSNDTEQSRKRNRRVEIEFVSMEEGVETVEVAVQEPESGRVQWVREPITDPAWLDRALRNPVAHKRTVDTYRTASVVQETRSSDRRLINTLPDIVDDAAQTRRDREVTIPVLANDNDVDGPLRVVAVSAPGNGMAVVNADGTVTYTPAPGFTGSDEFTYTAVDEDGAEGTATVSVSVLAPDPVVAVDDTATTPFNLPVTIEVLTNDQGMNLIITGVSQPVNGGTAQIEGDAIVFTPALDDIGNDTFTYSIMDDFDQESTATVVVAILPPPVQAADDMGETLRNQPVTVDVLANDSGQGIFLNTVGDPSNGSVSTNSDGTVTYTPDRNFVGTDQFTYIVSDPADNDAQATVTIVVAPFNRSPIAVDDEATTQKDTAVTIDVLANDSDPDNDDLTIVAVSPQRTGFGSVEITADNRILYTPNPGWWGGDAFTYTIDDGFGGQATASVVLDVQQ